jgi:hypothetical protein
MKNYNQYNPIYRSGWIILCCLIASCTTISLFDQQAYSMTTSLKVDALNLMDSAISSCQLHQAQVQQLTTALAKTFEYEKHRPQNGITVTMWAMLTDTSGHLLGGFIKRWQRQDTLDEAFIRDAKSLVAASFDQIAQLESGKIKRSQIVQP